MPCLLMSSSPKNLNNDNGYAVDMAEYVNFSQALVSRAFEINFSRAFFNWCAQRRGKVRTPFSFSKWYDCQRAQNKDPKLLLE